ncbi:hypothetical protein HKX48_002118, partial [Thoreauomyces humboldtii]
MSPFTTLTFSCTSQPSHVSTVSRLLAEASHIYVQDQGTLAWLVHQDDKRPERFLIVEVYDGPEAVETHRRNPHFKVFGETVGPLLEEGSSELTVWSGIEGSAK